jgi:hypothetical protein
MQQSGLVLHVIQSLHTIFASASTLHCTTTIGAQILVSVSSTVSCKRDTELNMFTKFQHLYPPLYNTITIGSQILVCVSYIVSCNRAAYFNKCNQFTKAPLYYARDFSLNFVICILHYSITCAISFDICIFNCTLQHSCLLLHTAVQYTISLEHFYPHLPLYRAHISGQF